MRRREESEALVWLTVAVALLIGLGIANLVLGRTASAQAGGMTLAYPAAWVPSAAEGADFTAVDLRGGGIFGARVSMRSLPKALVLTGQANPRAAAQGWSLLRGQDLSAYRILDLDSRMLNGREAASLEYAYVAGGPLGSASNTLPALMRAVDTLVESGDRYYILSFAAEANDFARLTDRRFPRFRNVLEDLLAGWRVP